MGRAIGNQARGTLPFRSVNRRGCPGHDAGLQKHHLLPRQLLTRRCFSRLFSEVGREALGFDDFRRNGILLPARDEAVWRTLLPLHRGPHRDYNAMVIERVGIIEGRWSHRKKLCSQQAGEEALLRLGLLQSALRKRLLDQSRKLVLNRRDPALVKPDFSELDAMAEALFAAAA
ncbi:AHH domain-containing protein [Qipengyuania sp. 1NDH17]|uniref:AHH domain-containing protein n=1 Tax=Qipengyuania polymorpha TaxID=2867234 RepID=A0ABS7IVY3_9SPHN|nr:AHH domain-containing protein [Qipengyuania polymorpha]MBX7457653.1 AHH domain-containing protein [Qipengyuania polymorpha]